MPQGDIYITGGAQLERIIFALNTVDKELARELKAELRAVGRRMVPKVRERIDEIPSKHDGTLRAAMKAATTSQFRSFGPQTGMTIRVDGRKMPAGKRSLPKYLEGVKKPFRHPVFQTEGRDVWTQQPSHPYFFRTVEPVNQELHREINAIAERIARKLQ